MKITLPVIGWSLLASLFISLCAWSWLVLNRFPGLDVWTLLGALLHTFSHHDLRPIALQALVLGVLSGAFILYMVRDGSADDERVLRGARLVAGQDLSKLTRLKRREQDAVQVAIAGVPIPTACETSHFLLAGSTGAGKSTAVDELMSTILARGDRMIVVDPNGHALARFGRKGDRVLNPFDRRSPQWSLFAEVRKPYDYDRLAKSVVPDSADSGSQQWHSYAQQLLAETMRAMAQAGENTTGQLLHWLTVAPAAELASFLAGSAASGLFEPGAEKALASTRFILSHHIGPYQHLPAGDFSLRTWLESGKGNLFITWQEDMLDSLRPLVSGWVDILVACVLTMPTESPRPLWLVLDELASLERLTSLEAGLTKGRKHGLRIVAGLQSIAQLDARYGRNNATTLRSCFRNLLALGCANSDPDTAEVVSKGLGQVEIERIQTSRNQTQSGNTVTTSLQRSVETLVLPTELMSLPPLHGYLKLAGNYPVARIRLTPGDYPVRGKSFMERSPC